ncbi:hypothetical protein KJI95_08500 [Shewanella sp. JM162201]|uniref:Uncharacterized protein n=1 Tax=Shewanella jiangmenensis TaxID=2837387 RepID=A0ABS5V279_9GAMM|nr:hypothetical protein [Shewanella jiangmenensis]MBT1444569.1 hypothetical protein [Shewanella jiangmenensis]
MPLTNARDWSLMCDKQAKLMENMRSHFPERREPLTELSHHWRDLKRQLDQGGIPRILPHK